MIPKLIGIYGGTFDPVQEIQKELGMEQVKMVLSAYPPHRKQPLLTAEGRFKLLEIALRNSPFLMADDTEMLREGPSYMVDTLRFFREKFPEHSLALILGMEAFNGLLKWYHWEDLLNLAHIVVTDRAAFENTVHSSLVNLMKKHQTFDKQQLKNHTHGKIYRQNVTPLAVSATQLRQLIKEGKSVSSLIPVTVYDEIVTNNWYA